MAHFLEELQEMIDTQQPVQDIIDKIKKANKRQNSLVFIFLLSFILESLLRKVLENDDTLNNNIKLYYTKFGNSDSNKEPSDEIYQFKNNIYQKSLYDIKNIRNNIAHEGQIYKPREHEEFIKTSLGFIHLISQDRGVDLKNFLLPKKVENLDKKKKIKNIYFVIPLALIVIIFFIFKTDTPKTTIFGGLDNGTYDTFSKNISAYVIKGAEVKNSQGSIENLESLNKNPKDERRFAFVQRDVLEKYLEEALKEDLKERDILKGIRILFPIILGEVHLLVKEDSNISSFSDLEGRIISFGSKKSGTSLTAKRIYKKLFNNQDIKTKFYKDFNNAVKNLKDGTIDAIILAGGQPLHILSTIKGIKLVPYLRDEVIDGYSECWIKKESYPKLSINSKKVRTLCVESFLLTNIKDDNDAYLKSVLDNFKRYKMDIDRLLRNKKIHLKWRDFSLSKCLPKLPFRLEYHSLTKWDTDREICTPKKDK